MTITEPGDPLTALQALSDTDPMKLDALVSLVVALIDNRAELRTAVDAIPESSPAFPFVTLLIGIVEAASEPLDT
jgi:hypothetical protein